MSGGSRGYISFKIKEELCGRMYDPELNDLMEDIKELAHAVEWMDDGDSSRDTYFGKVRCFKQKWFEMSRQDRLKDYIDKKLEDTRQELYRMVGENE
ncbi:MAG: hypothetical protein IKE94_09450 [Aeriscardovia sp.]|nr:hypothetical protein [Aeriscardovia sp.]